MARASNFGHNRERQIKALMEADNYFVIRAPASLGYADLVALRAGAAPRLIESKANAGSPFKNFPPKDRKALIEAADLAGGVAVLAHWPPHGELKWIWPDDWP